ncbi:hypothetical protein GJ496_008918 [Pomphorhynchus laevis]|nr:hypothetical protein GJ496_008918 [Pomphorhynchus laevis]
MVAKLKYRLKCSVTCASVDNVNEAQCHRRLNNRRNDLKEHDSNDDLFSYNIIEMDINDTIHEKLEQR